MEVSLSQCRDRAAFGNLSLIISIFSKFGQCNLQNQSSKCLAEEEERWNDIMVKEELQNLARLTSRISLAAWWGILFLVQPLPKLEWEETPISHFDAAIAKVREKQQTPILEFRIERRSLAMVCMCRKLAKSNPERWKKN